MKKKPKNKLSINKESLRRLSASELTVVRGGEVPDGTPVDLTPEVGTARECVQ